MKLIDDIRRENLAKLRKDFSGGHADFAAFLGKSESQVTQWIMGSTHSVTGKPRGMRSGTARLIEAKCGKPAGWLDIDHSPETQSNEDQGDNEEAGQAATLGRRREDWLPVPIKEAIELLKGMSMEGQYAALGTLRQLAKEFPAAKANAAS